MDVTNVQDWEQQWTTFMSAPFIIFPPIVIAGLVGWWLQGTKSAGQIAGLKEQVSVMEQRLKLATEQAATANQAENEFARRMQTLETAIAAKADNDSLSALAADVKTGFDKLAAANNALSSTVSISSASTGLAGAGSRFAAGHLGSTK